MIGGRIFFSLSPIKSLILPDATVALMKLVLVKTESLFLIEVSNVCGVKFIFASHDKCISNFQCLSFLIILACMFCLCQ